MNIETKRVPINPVARFVDGYGDERIIHRGKKGRRLSVFNGPGTPQQQINRAVAVLLGQAIRVRRQKLGLSMRELSVRAGLVNVSPKQYISSIERASRQEGVRLGTLYALASALECEAGDLLPTVSDACQAAGIRVGTIRALGVTA